MTRDLFVAGEVMVYVKGPVGSAIANLTQLGLAVTPITWNPIFHRLPVMVNATGQGPVEIQLMGTEATVQITFVHFDWGVLNECIRLSQGSSAQAGTNVHAGYRMGNSSPRFSEDCFFIGLNLSCPVAQQPVRFLTTYLADNPFSWPVGAERSLVSTNWHAISYTPDPWNDGEGLNGVTCWDYTLDQ